MNSSCNFVFGPRFHKSKTKVGGIVVSFESFLEFLTMSRKQITANVFDLNKNNYNNKIQFFYLYICFILKIIANGEKAKVIFFGTANDYKFVLPLLVLVKILVKFDLVTSKFAGNFDYVYKADNFFYRWLIKFCLKNTTANFFQTKYLVDYFEKFNVNTFQLPTSRDRVDNHNPKKMNGNLVYVGSITIEKGMEFIFELSKSLPKNIEIDLYGPINCPLMLHKIKSVPKLNYLGLLDHSEVQNTLRLYKYLLYPTNWIGEGYSGVVIESMMAGTPVIASDLRGLSEIIQNGFNGFTFCHEGYVDGVLNILQNEDNYELLVENCTEYSRGFDRKKVLLRLTKYIETY